ncbi:hypothetical protein WA556_006527, partial [Blastocystis sp. ATCC 50177/Nand II]
MEEDSLLSQFGLQNLGSLFKNISDPSYIRYLGKQYRDEEDMQFYAVGDAPRPELYAIAQGPPPTQQYRELNEQQIAGIMEVTGNSKRVAKFCPFREGDRSLIQTARYEQPSKRSRGEDVMDVENSVTGKMQFICSLLMKRTWVEYNNENPFIPRLTKTYIRQNNIPDYLDRVSHPMSLTDINQNIRNQSYRSVDDMEQDVKLIADNALLYHSAQSLFARLGNELYNYFKELRKRY